MKTSRFGAKRILHLVFFILISITCRNIVQAAPDIYCIFAPPASDIRNKVEIDYLSAASGYTERRTFVTTLNKPVNSEIWSYFIADFDHDGKMDLIAVKRTRTTNGHTEIHVYSGAMAFQSTYDWETSLGETDPSTWEIQIIDYNNDNQLDFVGIKRAHTSKKRTELHILSGAEPRFRSYLAQTPTAFEELSPATCSFRMADVKGDGNPTLIGIYTDGTPNKHVEVHALSRDHYDEFLPKFHLESTFDVASPGHQFEISRWVGPGDLFAIYKDDPKTGRAEVHINSQKSGYKDRVADFVIVNLGLLSSDWQVRLVEPYQQNSQLPKPPKPTEEDPKSFIWGYCEAKHGTGGLVGVDLFTLYLKNNHPTRTIKCTVDFIFNNALGNGQTHHSYTEILKQNETKSVAAFNAEPLSSHLFAGAVSAIWQ